MAREKKAPAESQRDAPAFWRKMIEASSKRREEKNQQFARYTRWHQGDLSEVIDVSTIVRHKDRRWKGGLKNMVYHVTAASLADLMFRHARFVIAPPYTSDHPIFSPDLARVETALLTHELRAAGFHRKSRRALQDALLGDMGILKITQDPDIVVDEEVLEASRAEARTEIEDFVANGTRMKAAEDQLHSVHTEIKGAFLAMAERGDVQLPRAAKRYLRKHIAAHNAMKGSERPTETIRASHLQIRRVNPLDYSYDPTVDDRCDASWKACNFLMRKKDVLANPDFNTEAKKRLGTANDRWADTVRYMPRIYSPRDRSFDIPEEMIKAVEVFDFVDQQRYLFEASGNYMLIQEDRGDLAEISPSGPFEEIVFIEDALEGQGIAPISAWEGEQVTLTHIAAQQATAAIQNLPRLMYNANEIKPDDMSKIHKGGAGEAIPVKPAGPPGTKLENSFAQAPRAENDEQNFAIAASMEQGIEKRSGLTGPKLGGGESTNTATASALLHDAGNIISDDRGAIVDEWQERCGRKSVRHLRRFGSKIQVVEICGPEAAEVWPDRWPLRDAKNDYGVTVVPGSSRRMNTTVDRKMMLDGLNAFSADPGMQGPAAQGLKIQMYRRYFEDGGVVGLDWDGVENESKALAMMQGLEGEISPENGPEGPPDPSEAEGTAQNDISQGVANVGGGRVPTGAGLEDRVRTLRNGATKKVLSRG